MCCSLYHATENRPATVSPEKALTGTTVSSLHRLKDIENQGKCLEACHDRIICELILLEAWTVVFLSLETSPSKQKESLGSSSICSK